MAKKRSVLTAILLTVLVVAGLTTTSTAASAAPSPISGPSSGGAPTAPAPPPPVSFSKSTPNGAYQVTTLELPTNGVAAATVTGPSHYKLAVSLSAGTQTFFAKPGKYTLTAQTLVITTTERTKSTPGTYVPVKTKISFTVKKHKVTSVKPDYGDEILPNVKVAPASALTPFTPPTNPGDPYAVGVKGTYSDGAIIASGISADAPYGLLVKVDDVGSTDSNGVTTYTVENASLEDAIPRGALSQNVSNAVSLSSSDPGSASPTGRTAKAIAGLTQHTESSAPPYLKDLDCKDPLIHLHLGANLSGDIKTELSANWNILDSSQDSVTLTSTAELKDELDASVTGTASCNLDKVELLAEPIELGTIEFLVGPVPVVINNTMNFTLVGSANVEAKLDEGIKATVTTSSSATISPSGITGQYVPPTPKVTVTPPTLSLKGEAQFYLGARLNMLFYDVAGPFVEAEIGPDLTVNTQKTPWWNVQLELKVGAGLRADFFGLKPIEDDHILVAIFPIANSNTFGTKTPPPSKPGEPGSPGNPWYPAPVDPTPITTDPGDPTSPTDTSPIVPLAGTGLDGCVNGFLGRNDSNAPVTENELASLTQLNCIYDPVTNIDALQYATNLESLILSPENNSPGTFTDLSALSGLTKLTSLDISENSAVTDLTPLASLTNLTNLDIGDDPGVDPSTILPLLPNLTSLNLEYNTLSDPATLASLHNLVSLDVIGIPLTSSAMTVIAHLPLTHLSVGGFVDIADVQDIGSMTHLTSLYIFAEQQLTDASFLTGMTHLTSLDLYRDGFANLSVLSTLPALQSVDTRGQIVPVLKDATVGVPYKLPVVRDPDGHVLTPVSQDCDGTVSGNEVTFASCIGYVAWSGDSGTLPSGASWSFDGVIFPQNNPDFATVLPDQG